MAWAIFKKEIAFGILVVALVIGVVALSFFSSTGAPLTTTPLWMDAFTSWRPSAGTVLALHVKDNQFVNKDEPVLDIDPVDYRVALQEAQANLEMEKARLTEVQSRVETTRKQLMEIRAALDASRLRPESTGALAWKADADLKRAEPLIQEQIVTQEYYDQRKTNQDVAVAQVKSARENVNRLEGSVESQKSLIRQMEAAVAPQQALIQQREAWVEKAKLNLATRRSWPPQRLCHEAQCRGGNQVQGVQPLAASCPLRRSRSGSTANYKETELRDVKPGQKVEIKVDTYPGKVFHGRVNSLIHGRNGLRVSLFPPENATGNYVKIVSGGFPSGSPWTRGATRPPAEVGMSVVPTIIRVER